MLMEFIIKTGDRHNITKPFLPKRSVNITRSEKKLWWTTVVCSAIKFLSVVAPMNPGPINPP